MTTFSLGVAVTPNEVVEAYRLDRYDNLPGADEDLVFPPL